MQINLFVLLALVVVAFALGWFARKQLSKIRPDEVARADRYGNTAVDQTSAAIQSARERTQAVLDKTKTPNS